VAYSPDGKAVVTASLDKTAQLWDAATGKPCLPAFVHPPTAVTRTLNGTVPPGGFAAVAFSPDGKTILLGSLDKTARLWDVATGRPIGVPLMLHEGAVVGVAFHPSGRTIYTTSLNRVWIRDTATGSPVGMPLGHPTPRAVAVSPDGRLVLIGGEDGTARLFEADTGRPLGGKPPGVQLKHPGPVLAVAFSPESRTVLTGCQDGTARLWDPYTGEPKGEPMTHQGPVRAVAWSPDGRTILTGSDDGTGRLWDPATRRPIGSSLIHREAVVAVAYSPDGKTAVTGSKDGTARLWDTATAQPIGVALKHQAPLVSVTYSPNGQTVLTVTEDNTAWLWPVAELPDDPERMGTWIESLTGMALDSQGLLQALDTKAWQERRERSRRLDGPP
jgi:WD40 repeat protein